MDRRLKISALFFLALLVPLSAGASVEVDEEEIVFRLALSAGKMVFLVGDFNGWNPTMDRLTEVEGGYELRLFILPGKYRYLFIVEGVPLADPDNPNRDEEGNSFFIFRERDGRYEIVFEDVVDVTGEGESVETTFSGEGIVRATEAGGTVYARGSAVLVIEERAEADLAVGFEYAVPKDGASLGRSYVLGGTAGYRLDNGVVAAFTRTGLLDFGDPLATFGTVGPYDYPVGLFSRGLLYEGNVARLAHTRMVYASRIDGYQTGLESSSTDGGLFASRDLTDTDIIGVVVGRKIGRVDFTYIYRRDRRPKEGAWQLAATADAAYRGYEKMRATGVWASVAGTEGFTLEVEYLDGRSYLEARERSETGAAAFEPFDGEEAWEKGRRFFAGFKYRKGPVDARVSLHQTTITGGRLLREGRPDGRCTVFEGDVAVRIGDLSCSVGGSAEGYSAGNTGDVFWLQRRNFWLDGDRLTAGRIPFLGSRDLREVRLHLGWNEDTDAGQPFRTGFRLTMMRRADGNDSRRRVTEITCRSVLPLLSRLTHIFDIRYVSYGHAAWLGGRRFVDLFTALKVHVTSSAWLSVGAGVNPFTFDRWLYRFVDHGRERYLIERGIFDSVSTGDESRILGALERAETDLSEEWSLIVEADMQF
jgi:hypothetical protein